jgi:hypothetical protein
MKRDRLAEAEKGLGDAEASFRSMLVETLSRDPESVTVLLANSDYSPAGFPRNRLSSQSESSYQHACTCIRLRESLGLPIEGTVGGLFVAACAKNASTDGNRLGPRRLGKSLLESLRNET